MRRGLTLSIGLMMGACWVGCGDASGVESDGFSIALSADVTPSTDDVTPQGQVIPVVNWANVQTGVQFPVRLDTSSAVPGDFVVVLDEAPPKGAIQEVCAFVDPQECVRYVAGQIALVADQTLPNSFQSVPGEDLEFVGGSTEHVLLYLLDKVKSGGFWAQQFGGALEPGIHLLRTYDPVRTGDFDTWDRCWSQLSPQDDINLCGDPPEFSWSVEPKDTVVSAIVPDDFATVGLAMIP